MGERGWGSEGAVGDRSRSGIQGREAAPSDTRLPPSEEKNLFNDPFGILKDPMIGKTENRKTSTLEIRVAFLVSGYSLGSGVDLSVQLDQQSDLVTAEIPDERTDGELAPKFQPAQPAVSEHSPHYPLGPVFVAVSGLGR
jgi:hypothetical protein